MAAPGRDEKGHFIKGNKANPGGRPKGLAEQVRAATHDGAELLAFYLQVFRGELDTPFNNAQGERDVKKLTMKPEYRLEAAAWLADRGWGKAVQTIGGQVVTTVKAYAGLNVDKV